VVPRVRHRGFSGRERHSHARRDNLGYPARAVREGNYLYIWNMKPDRWPAGDPVANFADIDDGATKTWMLDHRDHPLFERSFGRQPEELQRRTTLRATLEKALTARRDPRLLGQSDIWESSPRHSPMRKILGGFVEEGQDNAIYQRKLP
jgi:N-sulfoglucosamine sulfohydrolase